MESGLVDAGGCGAAGDFAFGVALLAEAALANPGRTAGCRRTFARNKNWRRRSRSSRSRSRLSSRCRTRRGLYLEERFQFRAPERTTEEFLRELDGTDLLLPDQKESLGNFLASCDLVKFAKYEPGENELRELHGSAVRLVEETEPEVKEESENRESGNEQQEQLVNRKS